MPEIGGHAQPLGPRGQYRGNCFPAHQDKPRDDRILEEQAQSKKHRAISDTRQGGHQQISAELMKARPIKNVGPAGGTKSVVGQVKASENGAFEEKNGDQRARQKLPDDQDFSSHRNKKLVMEGALDHLAAKQPGENTHAREKDAQPHVVKMNNAREHARLGLDVEGVGGMVSKCQLDQENHNRDRGQEIDPQPSVGEQVAADLVARENEDLSCVKLPGLFLSPLLGPSDGVSSIHVGPPLDPIRYW